MNKVRDFEIDEYSAIVAVGGDGSIHEVINGMLRRPDQKRLPIAFIPNGTGNCTCAEMSILDVQTALTFLVKGDVIKTDISKVLMDYEDEASLNQAKQENPTKVDFNDHIRYSNICVNFALIANCNRNAAGMKKCLGQGAYTLQTVIEMFKKRQEKFDIDIDEGTKVVTDLDAQFINIFNGKCAGPQITVNPLGMLNDSYMELIYLNGLATTAFSLKLFDGAKKGGIHLYENDLQMHRFRKLKLGNKSLDKQG